MTRMESGDSGARRERSVLVHEFVTGGGLAGAELPPSLRAEGDAMRRALAADFARVPGVRVVMTLDARSPHEPGPWDLVRVGPGQEPGAFARLSGDADYTLVIAPETGGILFDRARILDRLGARSLGCTPASIADAGNKLVAFDRFLAAGVRTPPTRAVSPRDAWPRRVDFPTGGPAAPPSAAGPLDGPATTRAAEAEVGHPAVLKPVDGAGSTHTFLLEGEADWPDPGWSPEVALLQPRVDGDLRSASVLVDREGRPHVLGFASQRTAVDRGRISYEGGIAPLRFGEGELRMVSRVVRALPGLRGWVGIDFVDDGTGMPVVLEVNPRPTTSVVAFLDLLGPGTLATAWLALFEDAPKDLLAGLFRRIRSRLDSPIAFDPDGSIHPLPEGARP
ncbi:ATP-grasp domain-containing protein [Tautonia plasticadhaerens]|uniref:Carbamoyl phosphate synthase-like protein n=1 Tax=Tautonia plasticadhaerens TaxID=2527974 RepID=A0A518GYL1_9BACT|nr:ATP-grasp domain-containing protein [Tautonia plasticadhaerens]QDV33690.1 carbamoyl phosphate synthase-like protein [Tautonia plasticadhaerens]